jgi:hypothetical protein
MLAVSIFRALSHICNFGKFLPDYTAQHPRRQSSSYRCIFSDTLNLEFRRVCSLFFRLVIRFHIRKVEQELTLHLTNIISVYSVALRFKRFLAGSRIDSYLCIVLFMFSSCISDVYIPGN